MDSNISQATKRASKKSKRYYSRKENSKKVKKFKGWIKLEGHNFKCPKCGAEHVIIYPIQDMFTYCPTCGKKIC